MPAMPGNAGPLFSRLLDCASTVPCKALTMSLEKHGSCLCGAVKFSVSLEKNQRQRLPLQHVPTMVRWPFVVSALRGTCATHFLPSEVLQPRLEHLRRR